MANYIASDTDLTAVANAIRTKGGTSAELEFPSGFVSAVQAIPSGGSSFDGVEYVWDSTGKVTELIWHGEEIPDFALNYCFWQIADANIPTFKGTAALKHIGDKVFSNCKCKIDYSTFSEVETLGEYALALGGMSSTNDHRDDVVYLPKYTGQSIAGITNASTFRFGTNLYVPRTYILPALKNIPQYAWYQLSQSNMSIQLGSVGHAVESCMSQPFAGASNATGTVTVYTTGTLLDTIKTAIQNNAGSGLQFVYKASENTTYGGSSYSAGDTILTVGGT